jgi:murein DD-endopeptidase MepM/ murein hydrolase activator NlpD
MNIIPKSPLASMTETDHYGSDRTNSKGQTYPHAGVDLKARTPTTVRAVLDGVVERASFVRPKKPKAISYGNIIVLYHGKNLRTDKHTYTLYAHLSRMDVTAGKEVKRGQDIAKTGNSGNVKPHLHFEAKESPEKITWKKEGNSMGVYYGLYKVGPMAFLKRPFAREPDALTETEMESFYAEIKTDMRTGPRPAFLVDLPDYRRFIKRARGEYPPSGEKPPKVKLTFKNNFSREFRSLFPILDLEVK